MLNNLADRLINQGEAVSLSYEEARDLAAHDDVEVRRTLAARSDVPPEILYFLSVDKATEVRRVAAANPAVPSKARLKMAGDADNQVRSDVAQRIGEISLDTGSAGADSTMKSKGEPSAVVIEILEILARDQVTRVRSILAETLKDIADAPPDVIKRLAMDTEIEVSGPVLEFSPVLTDEDLMEIIAAGPANGGVGAISRRSTVTERVADAVVGTNDIEAIADLLGNSSAQIREETLDGLVEQASEVELWHAPLVGRPKLPPRAARQLASIVADSLLHVLEDRTDFDDETMEAVKAMVHRRVSGDGAAGGGSEKGAPQGVALDYLQQDPPIEMAQRLHKSGKLERKILNNAIQASDFGLVFAALVVRSGVNADVAKKILSDNSAKGVVALTWKCGLDMDIAVMIQKRMIHVPPADVLKGSGKKFPLTEDDMNWQLEFFGVPPAKG